MIEQMLAYNQKFVEREEYKRFATSKYPDKKIAILSCMDTRLVELLPAALGIRNGDVEDDQKCRWHDHRPPLTARCAACWWVLWSWGWKR